MIQELRCGSKLHGRLADDLLEVKCDSKFCGAGSGVVVLHYFDHKGILVRTRMFKDPNKMKARRT